MALASRTPYAATPRRVTLRYAAPRAAMHLFLASHEAAPHAGVNTSIKPVAPAACQRHRSFHATFALCTACETRHSLTVCVCLIGCVLGAYTYDNVICRKSSWRQRTSSSLASLRLTAPGACAHRPSDTSEIALQRNASLWPKWNPTRYCLYKTWSTNWSRTAPLRSVATAGWLALLVCLSRRCATCYRSRFETMCFGMNDAGPPSIITHLITFRTTSIPFHCCCFHTKCTSSVVCVG
jgi:hypothetical protein